MTSVVSKVVDSHHRRPMGGACEEGEVPQQPLPRREPETSPKTRGDAPECRPRNMVHSQHSPHTTRASHHTFFHQGRVNDRRRSFPYFSYSLVTSKQTPALHTRAQPALTPVTNEGAQSNAPNAAVGHKDGSATDATPYIT